MRWFVFFIFFQPLSFAEDAPVPPPAVIAAPATVTTAPSLSAAPAAAPIVAPATEAAPQTPAEAGEGEYEIDYEEEPGTDAGEEEAPAPPSKTEKAETKKPAGKRGAGGPAVQGSRAKHRFEPILKSETKSIYKKDGKPLDVDAD